MEHTLLYCGTDVLCIVLLGIMAYRAIRYGLDVKSKKVSFVATIGCSMLMNLFDILWHLGISDHIGMSRLAISIFNAGYYTALSAAAVCWYIFSEKTHGNKLPNKTIKTLIFTFLVVMFFFMTSTAYNGWFFTYDENGKYLRGPLFFLQFVPALTFSILSMVRNLLYAYSVKNHERRATYASICSFAIPLIACSVIQVCFQFLPALSVAPTISLLLTYTNSLKIQLSLDHLTAIYNRRMLVDELSHRIKSVKPEKTLYFIFIDIDDFKNLNDKFGHHEGDNALCIVADSLNTLCSETGAFCARYGGDEFAVIHELNKNENIDDFCLTIEERIAENAEKEKCRFAIKASVGYSEFPADGTGVQDLIRSADEHMYSVKGNKNAQ